MIIHLLPLNFDCCSFVIIILSSCWYLYCNLWLQQMVPNWRMSRLQLNIISWINLYICIRVVDYIKHNNFIFFFCRFTENMVKINATFGWKLDYGQRTDAAALFTSSNVYVCVSNNQYFWSKIVFVCLACAHTRCLTGRRQSSRQYLIDVDAMFLHVVFVVDLAALSKVHGQDPLCGQIPVDHGNLWIGR